MTNDRLPNFLYIGPDKAGSTWLYEALRRHQNIYVSRAKELFYFNDHYHRGREWYLRHFAKAQPRHRVIGEVSHEYLYSVDARHRIARDLPDVRLMVCLREPVDRAFSSYLYMIRQGRVSGSFEQALEVMTELVDHGLYAKHLRPYLSEFGRDRIHIAVFDDLRENPAEFLTAIHCFLGVREEPPGPGASRAVLPAARPRFPLLARIAKRAALGIREAGFPAVVSKIKSRRIVQSILFRSYLEGEKPTVSPATRDRLRSVFYEDVARLEELCGVNVTERWGYEKRPVGTVRTAG